MSNQTIDLRPARRTATAICVVSLPILVGVIRALVPSVNGDTGSVVIAATAAHLGATRLEIALALVAILVAPFFVLGFYRLCAPRSPVLASIGALVALAGWLYLPFVTATDVLAYELARHHGSASTWNLFNGNGAMSVSTNVFALGHEFGLVLLGIALWRARSIPRWAAVTLIVGDLGHLVGYVSGIRAVDVLGFAVLTVASVVAARAILATSIDTWGPAPLAGATAGDRSDPAQVVLRTTR